MPAEPTDPTTIEDAVNDRTQHVPPPAADAETPEADAAEQRAELVETEDAPLTGQDLDAVDPGDAAEQARVVDLDEDDYR
ncbi:hypothetical protein V1J52_05765 [Streptomyces sp. TRM 70351]|uniref:hypothetical protein n=1 Tax=Streptomyces sp. TRM 70351 TaxID=3116552 RepID=UPI002E7BE2EF|nr:hypothetical protein [Streptomyces sp. TRM 70351]MEE1927701.1 hypothetical protein [Streptomyces sp. TRM 70351]